MFDLPGDVLSVLEKQGTPEEAFAERVVYEERKAKGQFFTPPRMARAMVDWVLASAPTSFLDPAVGPGIFVDALAASRNTTVKQVACLDIDPLALGLAEHRIPRRRFQDLRFQQRDFLDSGFRQTFDAIVCNPPYLRHHASRLPEALYRSFDAHFGVRLSRLTNIYCLFLLKIARLLSPGGRAAVLTPAEFLNADFGKPIKGLLRRLPSCAGFAIANHSEPIFEGIITTAAITLFDASRVSDELIFVEAHGLDPLLDAFRHFGRGRSAADATSDTRVVRVKKSLLRADRKWRCAALHTALPGGHRGLRPLSDFARCTRGIATGANSFFTLTPQEVERWSLPRSCLKPCITKSAHARCPGFADSDHGALCRANKKAWILDVADGELPEVRKYLEQGMRQRIHERYLTRHRRPWYAIERRTPAPIWVTVFGRGNLRFVCNRSNALNLTAFHGIYPSAPFARFGRFLMAYFYSSGCARACALEHRVYGDGLLKFEPRDVERLLVPDLPGVSDRTFRRGTQLGEEVVVQRTVGLQEGLQARIDALFADCFEELHIGRFEQ